jgi:hypothetical protein
MIIKPLKQGLTNLLSEGICVIQLLMTKLKLLYDPGSKILIVYSLIKGNMVIALLLKK